METIDSKKEIIANLLTFDSYRDSDRPAEREFYAERLRLGKIFVYLAKRERVSFCPSRFAGYKNNTMEKHLAFEGKSGSIMRIPSQSDHRFRPKSSTRSNPIRPLIPNEIVQ